MPSLKSQVSQDEQGSRILQCETCLRLQLCLGTFSLSAGARHHKEAHFRQPSPAEILLSCAYILFEPTDEYKGDVARIIAYMALHYDSLEGIVSNVMDEGYETIIEWNKLDPVDSYEINRNNVIAEFQGNRNPFIDAPELVNVVFGDKVSN